MQKSKGPNPIYNTQSNLGFIVGYRCPHLMSPPLQDHPLHITSGKGLTLNPPLQPTAGVAGLPEPARLLFSESGTLSWRLCASLGAWDTAWAAEGEHQGRINMTAYVAQ